MIVHLGRLRDRSRKVLSVMEVLEYREGEVILSPVYVYRETGEKNGKIQGIWEKTGELANTGKLLAAGYYQKGESMAT